MTAQTCKALPSTILDAEGRSFRCFLVCAAWYFSSTEAALGNPIYRWDALAATKYRWWIRRFALPLLCDYVRLDHFRSFEGLLAEFRREPDSHQRAVELKGPGERFSTQACGAFGVCPL